MTEKSSGSITRLIPASRWNEFHEWPPQGGLRHLIFCADENNFSKVVKRIGRRVLIDEAAFFEWVSERNSQTKDPVHE